MYTILQKSGSIIFDINPSDVYNIYSEFGFDLYIGNVNQAFSSVAYNLIYSGFDGIFVFKASDFNINKTSGVFIKSNFGKTFIRKTGDQIGSGRILQNIENSDPYYFYNDPEIITQTSNSITPLAASSILNGILILKNPNALSNGFSLPSYNDLNSYGFSTFVFDANLSFDFHIINDSVNAVNVYGSSDNILVGDPLIAGSALPEISSVLYRMYKDFTGIYYTERL